MTALEKNGESASRRAASRYEMALIGGDLSQLSPEERVNYYNHVCQSLGLNPATQPFAYIRLSGQLKLYAKRDAADQLAKLHGVSFPEFTERTAGDVYLYRVLARDRDGRSIWATGAVSVAGLGGEALANAFMKAETKAHRRATLKICGLGWLDETEVETIPAEAPAAPEHAEEHGAPGRAPGDVPSPPVQSASPGSAEVKTRSRPPRSAISKGSPVTQEMIERLQAAARDAGLSGAEWTTHLRRFGADEAAGLLQEEWQEACDMLRREPYREHLRRETIARLIWENISIASAQNLPGQRQGWMQRIDRVYPEDDPTRDESRAGLYEALDEAVRERAEALGVTLKTTAQL